MELKLLLILPLILLLIFPVNAIILRNSDSYANVIVLKSNIKIQGFRMLDNEKYTLVYNNTCIKTGMAWSSLMAYCNGKCGYLELKFNFNNKVKYKNFNVSKLFLLPSKDINCNKFKILNKKNILK